jgi:hypothetical protein
MIIEGFEDLEEYLRQVEERSVRRQENPYVLYLIAVLMPHKEGLERQHVISEIERRRRQNGLAIPDKLEQTVQSAFQGHSSQSAAFRGSADLFHWPKGKGSGIWAVYQDRATKWLAQHNLSYVVRQP